MVKQTLDVFAEDVDLDVDVVAGFQMREIGDFPGFWDDGDFEVIVSECGDRQTNPFDRYRTFENQVPGDLFGIRDPDRPRLPLFFDTNILSARIYMTLLYVLDLSV